MYELERLYKSGREDFDILSQKVVDSIAVNLRTRSNIDSLMMAIIKENKLESDLIWLSTVDHISVTFNGQQYVTLYDKSKLYKGLDSAFQNKGIVVSGSLQNTGPSNLVSNITISTPTAYSNRIGFSLYTDTPHRTQAIITRMLPTFLLSLFSILSLATIFYITFRNWSKQKKLAEMKSDFVNSINHEFQTPLSAILVANKTLEKDQVKDNKEMVASLTGVIGRQAERLNSLFRQVIDITMMNEATLQKEPVIIEELLRQVVDDYMIQADNQKVEIDFKETGEQHTVLLDRFWVTTMIINMIENGIKYNTSSIKRISIFTTEKDRQLTVHIVDNGVGIPAFGIFMMQLMGVMRKLAPVGPTLPYDTALLTPFWAGQPLPAGSWSGVRMPVLTIGGGKSEAWMQNAQVAISEVLPNATHKTLPGQNHMVAATAIAPMIKAFLAA